MEVLEIIKESIISSSITNGQSRRIRCPICTPHRKKQKERTLAVKVDGDYGIFCCHHCDEKGSVLLRDMPSRSLPPRPTVMVKEVGLTEEQSEWLAIRGISKETAARCGVVSGKAWIRSRGGEFLCIGFPYINKDKSRATKWRDGAKNFTQTGAASSLWRIDQFNGGDLVICEGEMDALAFEESGIFATSVPNGAPSALVTDPESSTKKFSYLWDAKDAIDSASRVILAVDDDGPGSILSEEIARRVGRGKCWRVSYPDGCKDINDVLVMHSVDGVRDALAGATPWPVSGLRDASEFKAEALDLLVNGIDRGVSVGIPEVDKLFRPNPQTLTVCTGVPGSGKSAFLSWMSFQLANRAGWCSAVFSAETSTQIHILQLAALYCGKSFMGGNRMSEEEFSEALDWISQRFFFLDESDTEVDSVIERAQAAVLRHGVRLLIIDPYNFLTLGEHTRDENQTSAINTCLVSLKNFAVQYSVCVWLVAHPTKMSRNSDGSFPTPGGMDVSGSAAFFNVADNGISISRAGSGKSMLTSWKARFPWVGSLGEVIMDYDPSVGLFAKKTNSGGVISDEEDFEFDSL